MTDSKLSCRLAVVILLFAVFSVDAASPLPAPINRGEAEAREVARLSSLHVSADSIPVLYNLYDLSLGHKRAEAVRKLYEVAERANDTIVQYDALRHMANIFAGNDDRLLDIENKILAMKESPLRNESLLYVRMLRTRYRVMNDSEATAHDELARLIERYNSAPPSDPMVRAELLYALCLYLERTTHSELLITYLDKLSALIGRLPVRTGSIRNLFYTHAAIAYVRNENYGRVIETDRRMLAVMDSLRAASENEGRIYRRYDINRYSSFRRLLSAYSLLTPAEIEEYYANVLELANRNPQVARDLELNGRATIYYLMAKERYSEVLPLIRSKIHEESNAPYLRTLLRYKVIASHAVGDRESLLRASVQLNELLDSQMVSRINDNVRELRLLADVGELTAENARLEIERHNNIIKSTRMILAVSLLAFVLLLVCVGVLFWHYRKMKKMAEEMERTSEKMRQERDNLRHAQQELIVARDEAKAADRLKTDFINNMSHEVRTPLYSIVEYTRLIVDCIPADKAKYLDRFARTIEFNSKLILTLVNDVLDIAAMDNDKIIVDSQPVSVYHLCAMAMDTIFENGVSSNPNIKVVFNPSKRPDVSVLTDDHRAAQVLMNLLANAEKFTERGSVTLDFEPDEKEGVVRFSVSDTGIGIPAGREDEIFLRFRKLDPSTHGVGLGLYIVRRLADLLGGKVYVDTDYHRGARFIFSLPIAK